MAGKKTWAKLWQKLKPSKSSGRVKASAGQPAPQAPCSRDLASPNAAPYCSPQQQQEPPASIVRALPTSDLVSHIDSTTTCQPAGEQAVRFLAGNTCNIVQASHYSLPQPGLASSVSCTSCSSAGPAIFGCGDSVSSNTDALARTLPHAELAVASRSSSSTMCSPVVKRLPPAPRILDTSNDDDGHRWPSPNFLTRATPPVGLFDLELLPCKVMQTLGSVSSVSSGTPTCAMPNFTPELPAFMEAADGSAADVTAAEAQCRSLSLVLSAMGTDADAANSAAGNTVSIAAAATSPEGASSRDSIPVSLMDPTDQLTLAPAAVNPAAATWPAPTQHTTLHSTQCVDDAWEFNQPEVYDQPPQPQAPSCSRPMMLRSHTPSIPQHTSASTPIPAGGFASVPVTACSAPAFSSTAAVPPLAQPPAAGAAPKASVHSAPWTGSAAQPAPARQLSGCGGASSLPIIQMLWPLCLTTDQGASFLSVKIEGTCKCGEHGKQYHASRLSRSDSHLSAKSDVSVCILLDATPLAVLAWDDSRHVLGGPVPALCPSQQASSTGLQVACAFATCPPASGRTPYDRAQMGSYDEAGKQLRPDGVVGVPGPAVSVLSVPAGVAQELHLQFALWVDAQVAEDQANAIHTGSPQYPGLADLHGLQQGGYRMDNEYLLNRTSVNSPCAAPDGQSPTSSAITRGSLLDGLFDARDTPCFASGGRRVDVNAATDPHTRGPYQRSHTSHLPVIPKPRKPSWLTQLHAAQLPDSLGSTPNSSQFFTGCDIQQGPDACSAAHHLEMTSSLPSSRQRLSSHSTCTTPAASSPSGTPCFARRGTLPDTSVGRLSLGADCPPPWMLSSEISQAATTVWAKQFVPLARDLSYLVLCVPAAFDHQRLSLCGEGLAAADALSKTWDRKTYCTALARMVCQLQTQQLWHTLAAVLTHAGEHGVLLKCKGSQLHRLDLTAPNLQRILQGVGQLDISVTYIDSSSGSCAPSKQAQHGNDGSSLMDLARPAMQPAAAAQGPATLVRTSASRRARTTMGASCPAPPAVAQPYDTSADESSQQQPAASLQRRASLPALISAEHSQSSPMVPYLQHAASSTCPMCSCPCDMTCEEHCACSQSLLKQPCQDRTSSNPGSIRGALMSTRQSILSGLPTETHTAGRTCSARTSVELREAPVRGFSSMDESRVSHSCALDTGAAAWGSPEFLDHHDRQASILNGCSSVHNQQQTDSSWTSMQSARASGRPSNTPDGRASNLAMESIMSSAADQWVQLLAESEGMSHSPTLGWPAQPSGTPSLMWASLDNPQHSQSMAGRTVSGALRTSLSSPTAATARAVHTSLGGALLSPAPSRNMSSLLPALSRPVAFASTLLGAGSLRGARTPAHVLRATFQHLQDVDPWWWHTRVMLEQLALIFLCMVMLLCLYV